MEPEDLGPFAQDLGRTGHAVNDLGKVLIALFHPWLYTTVAALHQFSTWVDETIQEPYRRAGSPHGNSVEGALHWLDERKNQHDE